MAITFSYIPSNGHVTYFLLLKSEDYPHSILYHPRDMVMLPIFHFLRVKTTLIACFIITHIHPEKIRMRSPK